jgi:hypothetical protein
LAISGLHTLARVTKTPSPRSAHATQQLPSAIGGFPGDFFYIVTDSDHTTARYRAGHAKQFLSVSMRGADTGLLAERRRIEAWLLKKAFASLLHPA